MVIEGTIFDIKRYAIHDGPGIRTTVFLKGCPLRCIWCHNPEGQNPHIETMLPYPSDGNRTIPTGSEVVGRVVSVSSVIEEIKKDVLFFDESGGGVTFSGGEPLLQPEFLRALLRACKEDSIHTALDTSGYASREIWTSVADYVDLVLFDLKILNDEQHCRYTGVSNRSILDNLRALDGMNRKTVIRFPVVPGITDTEENVADLIACLLSLKTIRSIALLPYHKMGDGKYARLKQKNLMKHVASPTLQRMEAIRRRFEDHGLQVSIGG